MTIMVTQSPQKQFVQQLTQEQLELLNYPALPPYLKREMPTIDMSLKFDRNYQAQIYKQILKKYQEQIIAENIAGVSGKKPIPTILPFAHLAYLLYFVFTFRAIFLSASSPMNRRVTLGIYLDEYFPDDNLRGVYQTNYEDMQFLMRGFLADYTIQQIKEIFDKIKREVPRTYQTENKHLFAVKNGIYDQKKHVLKPFSSDYVTLVKIPVAYKENPKNPYITDPKDGYTWNVDDWIYELANHDKDINTLIWQVIADCLQPSYTRKRSIWFYSDKGNNGKDTLGQLIKNVLGPGNYASLSVADFKHEFKKAGLIGVAANIADENDVNAYIDSVKDYKASITGDDIIINIKHEQPIRFQFKGANIQMMNGLPKTKDTSGSFYRRILIVPFVKSFTNNGERPLIKEDYIHRKEVLEYVLYKALHMEFTEFIQPEVSNKFIRQYQEINNPIIQYWDEFRDQFAWDLLPTQFLYDLYVQWAKRNNPNGREMSRRTFIDELKLVIESDPAWEIKFDRNDNTRTGSMMDADEPLISEFNLVAWMDNNYNGIDAKKKRAFTRKIMYRGLKRVIN